MTTQPTIILVHGFWGGAAHWSKVIVQLARMGYQSVRAVENPLTSPAGTALLGALRRDDAKPSDETPELFALGLISSRAAARQAMEELNGAGLLQGDPRLEMLRLNAALDDNGVKP